LRNFENPLNCGCEFFEKISFQLAIFILDASTLWLAFHALGSVPALEKRGKDPGPFTDLNGTVQSYRIVRGTLLSHPARARD
jgi:hypothetical protein